MIENPIIASIMGGILLSPIGIGIGLIRLTIQTRELPSSGELQAIDTQNTDPINRVNHVYSLFSIVLLYSALLIVSISTLIYVTCQLPFDSRDQLLIIFGLLPVLIAVLLNTVMACRTRNIIENELSLLLQQIAFYGKDVPLSWTIYGSKNVESQDTDDMEFDKLQITIRLAHITPTMFNIEGAVDIVPTRRGRMLNKARLRELRLKGWEINELLPTFAEFKHQWRLLDYSYIGIAQELAESIKIFGFDLKDISFRTRSFSTPHLPPIARGDFHITLS